ncbi:MAG TPA: GNAT family N-acyltransferase [Allosphingosinicella sp.]|nr:GNAT family N-acyltransferase [Allosphingosinicella sp.]
MGEALLEVVGPAPAAAFPIQPQPPLRLGSMEVRIAAGASDIRAAQALRYQVFFEEMGAQGGPAAEVALDVDAYDHLCDHLLAIHHDSDGSCRVVGTYRLLRQAVAESAHGFYSSGEYDLANLLRHCPAGQPGTGQLLELGRSCVAREHRNSATIGLLWRGIASYLEQHGIRFMFGCASFHGTDPSLHAAALSYLCHHHLAPEELRVRALAGHYVPMESLPLGGYDPVRTARMLPPLLKGYLRVGAMVGEGAFIDRQFNTVDVFVLMPIDRIASRYAARFQPPQIRPRPI